MKRGYTAGLGALAFGILPFVAAILANGPGGTYKASDVADFVKSGHRPIVFLALYLAIAGFVGLAFLLAHLREAISDPRRARIFWGLGLASIVGFSGGFALSNVVPVAMGYGGKGVTVAPQVAYVFSETGWMIISGAGGLLLGAALLVFALGPVAVPGWVRWSTLVAGVAAAAAFAWFPLALMLLWSIVIGLWLLATARSRVPETNVVPTT